MGRELDLLLCTALVSSECTGVWVFCPQVFASCLLYWVSQEMGNPIYEGLIASRPGIKRKAQPSTESYSVEPCPGLEFMCLHWPSSL